MRRRTGLILYTAAALGTPGAAVFASPAGVGVPFPEFDPETRPLLRSVGDLNGDGRDDFAAPVCEPMGVDVAMSGGDGFALVRFETSFLPSFVTGVDADGDGVRDLVIWSRLGQLADYRLGLGGGAFAAPLEVQYSRGLSPVECDRRTDRALIADVEGDGALEIVVLGSVAAGPGDRRNIMLVPIGDGVAMPEDARFGRAWLPQTYVEEIRGLSLFDHGGDGDLDLLYVVGSDYYLCRHEDGMHQRPELFIEPDFGGANTTLADLEGDGVPDLIEADPRFVGGFDDGWNAARLDIRYARPDGSVVAGIVDTDALYINSVVNVGDVDGDGRDDMVVGWENAALVTGVADDPVTSSLRGMSMPGGVAGGAGRVLSFLEEPGPVPAVLSYGIDVAADGSRTFVESSGSFPAIFAGDQINRTYRFGHMQRVDIDGDGREELAMTDDPFSSSLAWILSVDAGEPELVLQTLMGDMEVPRAFFADVTGNGYPDMVWFGRQRRQAELGVLRNDAGAFGDTAYLLDEVDFDDAGDEGADLIAVGDVDDDGRAEILVPGGVNRSVIRFDFDGSGWQRTDLPVNAEPVKLGLLDADDDGEQDLVAIDRASGSVVLFMGDGAGGFGPEPTEVASLGARATWLELGDLDGDSRTDAVVLEAGEGSDTDRITAVWNRGVGTPDAVRIETETGRGSQVALLDVDRDGLLDLVATSSSGSAAYPWVYYQREGKAWSAAFPIGSLVDTASVTLFDWDGEGADELLLGPSRSAASSDSPAPLVILYDEAALCPADIDGNGRADFFDLAAFVGAFGAGDASADIAEPFGTFDVTDVNRFIGLLLAGCP